MTAPDVEPQKGARKSSRKEHAAAVDRIKFLMRRMVITNRSEAEKAGHRTTMNGFDSQPAQPSPAGSSPGILLRFMVIKGGNA